MCQLFRKDLHHIFLEIEKLIFHSFMHVLRGELNVLFKLLVNALNTNVHACFFVTDKLLVANGREVEVLDIGQNERFEI